MDLNDILMDENTLQKSRANRLKRLRRMTTKSRKEFSQFYSISQGTLQNWETGRFGGLTEKGARVVLKALRKEKVFCGFEWLMYGVGEEPVAHRDLSCHAGQREKTFRQSLVTQDIEFMTQLHKEAVTCYLDDDSMGPIYSRGCYVLGNKVQGKDIIKTCNKVCIVQSFDRKKMVRMVRSGQDRFAYNLHMLNHDSCSNPVLYNIELMYSAPIIWVRYPDR